jgi:hypothetical protein
VAQADDVAGRWSASRAQDWYGKQPWLVGCNFVPSTAVNDVEMWQAETFDPKTMDRDLGWAHTLGFNTVRVFLNFVVWKADPGGLKKRFDQFLGIADRHHIKTMVVLLDDCFKQNPHVGKQDDPVPGVHNSQWVASPGEGMVKNPGDWAVLEQYVKDMVHAFAHDRRVVVWDLYNEPSQSLALVEEVFRWAREVAPDQPLTSCVYGGSCDPAKLADLSDIISFHNYSDLPEVKKMVDHLSAYHRPLLCTEWMRRPESRFETHLPYFKEQKIGAWNWGLVAGRTQTYFSWGSSVGAPEPDRWFHDILHADGAPFDRWEVRVIRGVTGASPPLKTLVPTAENGPVAWRYTLEQPPVGWREPDFDDRSWESGMAPFGREEMPIARKPNTVWTSADIREVELPRGKYSDLALVVHYDEDPEVFIDGVLAWKARGFNASYELVAIDPAAADLLRKPGKHTLAVHCHQTVGGQYIDLGIAGAP